MYKFRFISSLIIAVALTIASPISTSAQTEWFPKFKYNKFVETPSQIIEMDNQVYVFKHYFTPANGERRLIYDLYDKSTKTLIAKEQKVKFDKSWDKGSVSSSVYKIGNKLYIESAKLTNKRSSEVISLFEFEHGKIPVLAKELFNLDKKSNNYQYSTLSYQSQKGNKALFFRANKEEKEIEFYLLSENGMSDKRTLKGHAVTDLEIHKNGNIYQFLYDRTIIYSPKGEKLKEIDLTSLKYAPITKKKRVAKNGDIIVYGTYLDIDYSEYLEDSKNSRTDAKLFKEFNEKYDRFNGVFCSVYNSENGSHIESYFPVVNENQNKFFSQKELKKGETKGLEHKLYDALRIYQTKDNYIITLEGDNNYEYQAYSEKYDLYIFTMPKTLKSYEMVRIPKHQIGTSSGKMTPFKMMFDENDKPYIYVNYNLDEKLKDQSSHDIKYTNIRLKNDFLKISLLPNQIEKIEKVDLGLEDKEHISTYSIQQSPQNGLYYFTILRNRGYTLGIRKF